MKNNIITAQIKIKGYKPILFHQFNLDVLSLSPREKSGVAGHDPEEWRNTYPSTGDGQLYIPASYMYSCIREGAGKVKLGRGNARLVVAGTLEIIEEELLIDRYLPSNIATIKTVEFTKNPSEKVYLDVRSVRNPSTKARNIRYRVAASAGWTATATIQWDKTIVNRELMETVIIDAGRLCGVGDGRGIGYGRFELIKYKISEVIRDAEKATA